MMDRLTLVALVVVLAVLVAGYLIIIEGGHDESSYVIFLAGPLVSGIVGAVLTQRTARVEAVVKQVEHQTNHLLTARLDRIDGELNTAAIDRADDPTSGRQPQTPNGVDPQL